MVYVDQLRRPSYNVLNGEYCNLMADDINELHAFAEKIGVRSCWFEKSTGALTFPHYRLTGKKRQAAIVLGAQSIAGPKLDRIVADLRARYYSRRKPLIMQRK